MANETNTGWVRLYRSTLNWEWFDDPLTLQLWVVCLIKANHAPTRWQGIEIERGSFISSVEKLCAATGQTARQIRTRLTNLQTSKELTIKTTNRFSIITVCNYDIYQPIEIQSDKLTDNQATNGRQTDDKRTTTNNNNKELNNKKEYLSFACAHATDEERDIFFEIFFFRNFQKPEYEVERFCANYEASGWIRKNGQPAVDRLALARSWTQEDKNAAPRFTTDFLKHYKELYAAAKQQNRAAAATLIRDLKGIAITNSRIDIACSGRLMEIIERNLAFFKTAFFEKHYAGLAIHYHVPRK